MTGFKLGDWVRINQHPRKAVADRTGMVVQERIYNSANSGEMFVVLLDEPLADGIVRAYVFDHEMTLLQSRDVITIVSGTDGATVAAVHDPNGRSVDVVCSAHPAFLTFTYDVGTTDATRNGFRTDA